MGLNTTNSQALPLKSALTYPIEIHRQDNRNRSYKSNHMIIFIILFYQTIPDANTIRDIPDANTLSRLHIQGDTPLLKN